MARFFNPFPKYLQVRDILRRRLGRELAPGDKLPTEHKLVEEFGVSRETIREALHGLEDDGLIRRRRGAGTIVAKLPDLVLDERLTGLVDDFTELKFNTEAKVLSKAVERPPPEVIAALHVSADEPMYRIRRLRLLDGAPLVHHDGYLPVEIGVAVGRSDMRRTTVLREISKTLRKTVHERCQQIEATVADTEMAELLQVPVGAPLLVITRIFAVNSDDSGIFFKSHFRSDRYYYTVQLAPTEHRRDGVASEQRQATHPRERGFRAKTVGARKHRQKESQ